MELSPDPKMQGYYSFQRVCSCKTPEHIVTFSDKVRRVFGFEAPHRLRRVGKRMGIVLTSTPLLADRPASLSRAIPNQFYVYSDLCTPYTVGDVQASLLRVVAVDTNNYKIASTVVKHFTPINYFPLLNNSFHTVIIDIKDEHGERIPFEYGTLTNTSL